MSDFYTENENDHHLLIRATSLLCAGIGMLASAAVGAISTQLNRLGGVEPAAAPTATLPRIVIPDYVSPSTRVKRKGEAEFARSGGTGLRWTAVAGPNATLPKLMVRWYGGLMFVKLRADSCPPLKLFLEDDAGHTPHNWNEREKAVRKQGYYIEVRKKGRSADSERIVVVELDALMWLLKERNREKSEHHFQNI